jgi:hypothetical protein
MVRTVSQKYPRGRGISLLSGPSGTGKTMAEVLAQKLRLDLYRIDLSQVVSKYIGETEKNLRRVFDAAEGGGAILLFDEADALFGKRSEVKDSHDRYANIEVSYLLQRMEEYSGLAILATNMKGHLDSAFMRRLRYVIDVPFPDAAARRLIWQKAFPAEMRAPRSTSMRWRGSTSPAATSPSSPSMPHSSPPPTACRSTCATSPAQRGREYHKLDRELRLNWLGVADHGRYARHQVLRPGLAARGGTAARPSATAFPARWPARRSRRTSIRFACNCRPAPASATSTAPSASPSSGRRREAVNEDAVQRAAPVSASPAARQRSK